MLPLNIARRALLLSAIFAMGAGSAMADDSDFCGTPSATPAELLATVGKIAGVKEVHKDQQYVAYQDPAAETVYTFTLDGHNAHPAAVCRKPVKAVDSITLQMTIVCKGDTGSCAKLRQDFNELNARMQLDINEKAGIAK